MSVEVQDYGTWQINGALGELLRVASARLGSGSVWMELKLEIAADLGVIRLEDATVRVTVAPTFGAELRGLTATVDIDGVLEGEGSVSVGDHGDIRALLALDIIPAKVSAYGALALNPPFADIEVGVQFPVGIPLASTGLAVFGFNGRFVANGKRDLSSVNNPDPVQRELDWFANVPPQNKYTLQRGQYAIGFGTVIGTLPDAGFSLNAAGSLCVEFPDIAVILGVSAQVLTGHGDAEEQGSSGGGALSIIGLTVIDETGITIGLRGTYDIPKVLHLVVPVSARFPFSGGDPWFIRIGTDNVPAPPYGPSRAGSPVTLTLFPDTLNVKATGFLMFEEAGIGHLGNDPSLNLYGFSIGFGAGFSVDFGAGPFRLTGSARMLVGIGTRPLMLAGAIQISGSLSLVVVSLSLSGTLNFRILDGHAFFEGHFCAGIDCWFFSISGCVDITFVDDIPDTVPPPQSPIGSIDLCDHRSAVKRTLTATATPGTPLPVVWPDTLPVIHFQHGMQDGVIGVGAAAFNIAVSEPSIPTWSGTNALKYAFRLESVDIFKLAAGGNPTDDTAWTRLTGRFDAAWWFPSGRAAIITTGTADAPASAEEGRDLGLFWWHPSPWARWLDQSGGAGLPGDPAKPWSQTCTPTPPVTPACAFGSDASSIAIARTTITSRPQVGVAFPSQFNVALGLDPTISPTLLFALATQVGYAITPPGVVSLSRSTVSDGVTATQALRLPSFGRQGRFLLSLPVDAALTPSLVSPVVTLEFCPDPQRDPTPVDLGIGGGTSTTCEIFDELEASRVARGLPTDAGTLIVPELASEAIGSFSDGGTLGLVVPANGMHADLPGQFKEVTVSGFAGAGLTVQGLDVSGNVVASGIMQGPGPRSVDLGATAIVRVRMIPFSAPGGGGTGGGGAGGGGTGGGGTGGGGTGGGGTGGGGTGGGGTGGGAGGGNGLSGSSPGDVGCANSTCFCSTSSTTGGAGRTGGTAGGPGTSGGPDGPSGPGLTGSPDNPGNGPIGPGTGPTGEPGSGDPGGLGQPPTDTGGNAGPARIVEICRVTSGLGVPVDPGSFVPPAGALPTVVGVLPTGDEVVFPATVIDVPPGAPPPCQHVSYQAPDNTTVWTLIRVKPFALGPIKIISICGVTTEALAAQAADQQLRNTLVSAGNNFAVPATGGTPTRHVALAPASTYQIRVRWTYQGWKAEHTGDSPPSLSNKWLDGTTERFTFSTADWGTVANPGGAAGLGPSPADGGPGFDESTFDAHGISRFVTYSQPADLAPDPFFVGDPLLFGFMVDHILELLGKYNATLTVQVLRTDPPLGALNGAPPHAPGTPNRLDVATGTTISRDPTTYFPAETRIASITSNPVTSPCMGVTPGFGASVAQVAANLDPDASYDLHLLAVRNSNEEVTIARAQFRTSHYRDVPALVSALGFGVTKPGLSAPRDFILTSAAPPLGDGGNSDGAMDAALAALGMDPWPLAASPEATLIWQAPSDPVSPWALVAILFEAEEPLERAPLPSDAIGNTNPLPRMTLSHLDVVQLDANNQPVGTSTLTAKIRNASGTRVLLFPATPLALVAGANYRLTLSVAEPKGVVTRGSAPLYDRPLTVILEGS
jgi:hypothetical protein